ncbi:unnamed protein product [Acanthoscelides obtectus]|uniref:Uncharacterized protein n=1 Tax=Acanthoscelides obtectus TaxID=200917 RepID=A0A9P0NYZ9_ACAOB|nr:unnamed protein product [Acanthoscelides obtectus]CAK1660361.1 hypothetical protein AOBTE_LOCUS22017 [Acanthoscelides obtectus]
MSSKAQKLVQLALEEEIDSRGSRDYKMVNMNRSSRKPMGLPVELCSPRQTPKGLTKKKHDHLLMLVQWILEAFHVFYKNVPVLGQQGDDDIDDDCIYILQMSFCVSSYAAPRFYHHSK